MRRREKKKRQNNKQNHKKIQILITHKHTSYFFVFDLTLLFLHSDINAELTQRRGAVICEL